MAIYRFPFGPDPAWKMAQGNWDDPSGWAHEKNYAFDLTHPEGAPILAARAGVVIDIISTVAGNDPSAGGGNGILIRHLDGTAGTYAHLKFNSIKVKKGDWVPQGQPIALSGNTGASTEPHCHFEVFLTGSSYEALGPPIPIHFQDANHASWRPRANDPILSTNGALRQDAWRWCNKCQGLFFGSTPDKGTAGGKCPADQKPHSSSGSGNYALALQFTDTANQAGWRYCSKCQGLFFGGNPGSHCPAGGAHQDSGSFYVLANNSPNATGQAGWRWCHKCQGLFFDDPPVSGTQGGVCPKDSAKHSSAGSGKYNLDLDGEVDASDVYQGGWDYCSKCQGLFFGKDPASSHCPGGGTHVNSGGAYWLVQNSSSAAGQEPWAGGAQTNWRWCGKCQGLFFAGIPNLGSQGGVCPKDQGKHSGTNSGDYRLAMNAPPYPPDQQTIKGTTLTRAPGQDMWNWCSKCQGLFFGGIPTAGQPGGVCPYDKKPHTGASSGNYSIPIPRA